MHKLKGWGEAIWNGIVIVTIVIGFYGFIYLAFVVEWNTYRGS